MVHPTFWLTPWYRHPYQVVKYWRAFLADPALADWPARVHIVHAVALDMYQAESAWESILRKGADAIQLRTLDKTLLQMDRVGQQIGGVGVGIDTAEVTTLWANGALPLVYAPGSIMDQLISIRNQLMQFGNPPEATVITGGETSFFLPDWGAPSWPADAFSKSIANAWVQAEKSAPGEPATSRDIAEVALKKSLVAAEDAYKASAAAIEKGAKRLGESIDWAPLLVVGGLYLWTRK